MYQSTAGGPTKWRPQGVGRDRRNQNSHTFKNYAGTWEISFNHGADNQHNYPKTNIYTIDQTGWVTAKESGTSAKHNANRNLQIQRSEHHSRHPSCLLENLYFPSAQYEEWDFEAHGRAIIRHMHTSLQQCCRAIAVRKTTAVAKFNRPKVRVDSSSSDDSSPGDESDSSGDDARAKRKRRRRKKGGGGGPAVHKKKPGVKRYGIDSDDDEITKRRPVPERPREREREREPKERERERPKKAKKKTKKFESDSDEDDGGDSDSDSSDDSEVAKKRRRHRRKSKSSRSRSRERRDKHRRRRKKSPKKTKAATRRRRSSTPSSESPPPSASRRGGSSRTSRTPRKPEKPPPSSSDDERLSEVNEDDAPVRPAAAVRRGRSPSPRGGSRHSDRSRSGPVRRSRSKSPGDSERGPDPMSDKHSRTPRFAPQQRPPSMQRRRQQRRSPSPVDVGRRPSRVRSPERSNAFPSHVNERAPHGNDPRMNAFIPEKERFVRNRARNDIGAPQHGPPRGGRDFDRFSPPMRATGGGAFGQDRPFADERRRVRARHQSPPHRPRDQHSPRHHRNRSPIRTRDRSPSGHHRGRSPPDRHRDQSPSRPFRGRSPSPRIRGDRHRPQFDGRPAARDRDLSPAPSQPGFSHLGDTNHPPRHRGVAPRGDSPPRGDDRLPRAGRRLPPRGTRVARRADSRSPSPPPRGGRRGPLDSDHVGRDRRNGDGYDRGLPPGQHGYRPRESPPQYREPGEPSIAGDIRARDGTLANPEPFYTDSQGDYAKMRGPREPGAPGGFHGRSGQRRRRPFEHDSPPRPDSPPRDPTMYARPPPSPDIDDGVRNRGPGFSQVGRSAAPSPPAMSVAPSVYTQVEGLPASPRTSSSRRRSDSPPSRSPPVASGVRLQQENDVNSVGVPHDPPPRYVSNRSHRAPADQRSPPLDMPRGALPAQGGDPFVDAPPPGVGEIGAGMPSAAAASQPPPARAPPSAPNHVPLSRGDEFATGNLRPLSRRDEFTAGNGRPPPYASPGDDARGSRPNAPAGGGGGPRAPSGGDGGPRRGGGGGGGPRGGEMNGDRPIGGGRAAPAPVADAASGDFDSVANDGTVVGLVTGALEAMQSGELATDDRVLKLLTAISKARPEPQPGDAKHPRFDSLEQKADRARLTAHMAHLLAEHDRPDSEGARRATEGAVERELEHPSAAHRRAVKRHQADVRLHERSMKDFGEDLRALRDHIFCRACGRTESTHTFVCGHPLCDACSSGVVRCPAVGCAQPVSERHSLHWSS